MTGWLAQVAQRPLLVLLLFAELVVAVVAPVAALPVGGLLAVQLSRHGLSYRTRTHHRS